MNIKHLFNETLLIITLATASCLLLVFSIVFASNNPQTVIVTSNGGTVTSNPAGINCPSDCEETYPFNTQIELTATPSAGRTFMYWQGNCYPPNCTFWTTTGADTAQVKVIYGYTHHTVTAAKSGTGSGTVSGGGISCGGACSQEVANGASITLTATAANGSIFEGWEATGLCSISGGKGASSMNPSPTCTIQGYDTTDKSIGTATARFTKTSTTAAPAPTQQNTPTNQNNTTQQQPTQNQEKPQNGTVVMSDQEGAPQEDTTFESGEPVVLKGKTVPNGKITLYIFSEPRTAQVEANGEGDWTYTIEGLEPGDHRVEMEVTNPTTNKTSDRQQIATFAVAPSSDSQDQQQATTQSQSTSKPGAGIWIALIAGLVVLSVLVFIFRKKIAALLFRPKSL